MPTVATLVASQPPASRAACLRPLANRADAELVALVRAGDSGALAEIDRRYRPLMLSIARPLVAETGYDPEDAVQDALIRAARALRQDDRDVELRPWLATVVRNRSLDLRRRRETSVVALPDGLPARAPDPADAVVRREDFLRTMHDLAALPPRQRAALTMRAFEGASHEELARRLACTVPAVKTLVMRARHALAAAAA